MLFTSETYMLASKAASKTTSDTLIKAVITKNQTNVFANEILKVQMVLSSIAI